jgi:glutamine amidotransferase
MTFGVIDYGAGNLTSVLKGLSAAGAPAVVLRRPQDVEAVEALVIPGVGHFAATKSLDDEWRRSIYAAIDGSLPVLAICLGMQWLFQGSDEAPALDGLDLLSGRCTRLPGTGVKVPHVGWNTLTRLPRPSRMLDGLEGERWAYFNHMYAAPVGRDTVAVTTHGTVFASCVEQGRVWGVQFHPEKSASTGLRILANFLALAREAA